GLVEGTQGEYLRAVRQLTACYMTSPDRLSERDVEDYLLCVRDELGVAKGTFAPIYAGLRFFYLNTLGYDGMVQNGWFSGDKALVPYASASEDRWGTARTAGISSAGTGYSPACPASAAGADLSEVQPEIVPLARNARYAVGADG